MRRTPALEQVLRTVHPHYHGKPDYPYFIVLTQSCDLVRRDGTNCASRYITIAAVRPLQLAVERYLDSLLYNDVERHFGLCDDSRKAKLRQFSERLLNNNEDAYFFLRREPSAGLVGDHCAFLPLSVALKAELHYEVLLEAKILQLKETFQHKLGYLVGKLYSRSGPKIGFQTMPLLSNSSRSLTRH